MHSATLSLLVSIVIATIFGTLTYQNFQSATNSFKQEVANVQPN